MGTRRSYPPGSAQVISQALPLEQLHYQERQTLRRFAEIEHAHDCRVAQHRGGPSFAKQAFGDPFALTQRVHQFYGDREVERQVVRLPHRPLASLSELTLQAVLAGDDSARNQLGGV